MTTQPDPVHHLLDRLLRGVILPAEAEQLARLVRELEARLTTEAGVARGNLRVARDFMQADTEAKARIRELEAENSTLRDWLAHCPHKPRIAELEQRVTELTAGQCTHALAICEQHHTTPVAGCPYPRCRAARGDQRAPTA